MLLKVGGNDANIYHDVNYILNMEVGRDICGIHNFESRIDNIEFGGDDGVIDESGDNAEGM